MAAYLHDPPKLLKAYLKEKGQRAPGRTKMSFKRRRKDKVADVVVYLEQFSKKPA